MIERLFKLLNKDLAHRAQNGKGAVDLPPSELSDLEILTVSLNKGCLLGPSCALMLFPDLVCLVDGNRIIRVNKAWEDYMGLSVGEILALPPLDVVLPEDREETQRVLGSLDRGPVTHFINRHQRKKGKGFVELSWSCTQWTPGCKDCEPLSLCIGRILREVVEDE
jgi:PAS domain-containing protein